MNDSNEQALAERVVHAMMAKDAFSRWLGIEILEVRPTASRVRLVVREEMVNGFGVCHGAVPFALADSALAFFRVAVTRADETVALFRGTVYKTRQPFFTELE